VGSGAVAQARRQAVRPRRQPAPAGPRRSGVVSRPQASHHPERREDRAPRRHADGDPRRGEEEGEGLPRGAGEEGQGQEGQEVTPGGGRDVTGDALTRGSIDVALAFCAVALIAVPWVEKGGTGALARIVRACWLLGWLVYLAHVALAFHYFHGWSHAEAV